MASSFFSSFLFFFSLLDIPAQRAGFFRYFPYCFLSEILFPILILLLQPSTQPHNSGLLASFLPCLFAGSYVLLTGNIVYATLMRDFFFFSVSIILE